jgi:hypothetical protein
VTRRNPHTYQEHAPGDPLGQPLMERYDATWECTHGSLPHDPIVTIACECWDHLDSVALRRRDVMVELAERIDARKRASFREPVSATELPPAA